MTQDTAADLAGKLGDENRRLTAELDAMRAEIDATKKAAREALANPATTKKRGRK